MGWLAVSSALKIKVAPGKEMFHNFQTGYAFEYAAEAIEMVGCTPDPQLKAGGLSWDGCRRCLEQATGQQTIRPLGWNAEQVHNYQLIAKWDFTPEQVQAKTEEFVSAKWFLEVCAKHNLSITFKEV